MLTERDFNLALLGIIFTITALLVFFLLISCEEPKDDCEREDTQCNGDMLEVCSEDQVWLEWMDCSTLEPIDTDSPSKWVCCELQAGAECVPENECK